MNVLKKYFERTNQQRQHFLTENHNYKEGPILQFWYIVDQDSPGVKKFVRGLSALMDECFPSERKDTDTVESVVGGIFCNTLVCQIYGFVILLHNVCC